MKKKKHRKNPDLQEIAEEIEVETELDDSDEAAQKEKEKREKKRRIIINRNSRNYILIISILTAIGLYCGYYFFPQMFFIIFSDEARHNNGTLKLLCSMMGFFVYFFYLVNHYLRKRKKHPECETVPDMLEFHPSKTKRKPALLCLASGICLNLSTSALLAILPLPESFIGDYSRGTETLLYTDNIALSIVYIVIIAPLCEEMMFRGFLLHTLERAFPEKAILIVISSAFAIPHINPLWIVVALGNGFLLTLIRIRYKNLTYPLAMHIGFNLVTIPMLLMMDTQAYTVLFDNIIAELIYLIFGGLTAFFCIKTLISDAKTAKISEF